MSTRFQVRIRTYVQGSCYGGWVGCFSDHGHQFLKARDMLQTRIMVTMMIILQCFDDLPKRGGCNASIPMLNEQKITISFMKSHLRLFSFRTGLMKKTAKNIYLRVHCKSSFKSTQNVNRIFQERL